MSIESKERNSERPFLANTVVIAAVKVVLPMNQVSKQWQNEVEKLGKEAKSLYDSYQASVKTLSDAQKTKKEEEIVDRKSVV